MGLDESPWWTIPFFPDESEYDPKLPWVLRVHGLVVTTIIFLVITQVGGLLATPAGGRLSLESDYYHFVALATIQISVLVVTLNPALILVFLGVTSRRSRGAALIASRHDFYTGIARLFWPAIWAAFVLVLVMVSEFLPVASLSPVVLGFYASMLVVMASTEVFLVLHALMSIRAQVVGEAEDAAKELRNLERLGKIRFGPPPTEEDRFG